MMKIKALMLAAAIALLSAQEARADEVYLPIVNNGAMPQEIGEPAQISEPVWDHEEIMNLISQASGREPHYVDYYVVTDYQQVDSQWILEVVVFWEKDFVTLGGPWIDLFIFTL